MEVFQPVLVVRRLRAIEARHALRQRRRDSFDVARIEVDVRIAGRMHVAERAIDAARVQWFPGSVQVHVAPGSIRVAIGTPVRIRASVLRGGRHLTQLAPTLTVLAGR